ncbi:hypothetical protein M7I_7765 [Glarea lozoyensis 74030]|uniref:Uncharacterized protein n=1 Tax=Glarea lozoyensis (strain ATCC 74030 / MF5533) TaxID=1104152 RepID=H0EY68_GLAL7|nr:hypothetical protein M7I_7765 [Glarea lozoyensis 74030]
MVFNITSSKPMEDTMNYSPVSKEESLEDASYASATLFIASTALFLKSSNITNRQDWALEQVSYFFQGDLFNEDNLLLRQYPSPEVDDAWEALTDVGVVIINKEEVVKLGKDPKKAVKAPPEWAQPDGQHALHCLNAIRKYDNAQLDGNTRLPVPRLCYK